MKDKILIIGYNSNLARNFISYFSSAFQMHLFNRKTTAIINTNHKIIHGDPFLICNNDLIDNNYLFIINYLFLRRESVHENIRYCESLIKLCNKQNNLKKLIHISSTMVHGFDNIKINLSFPPKPTNYLHGYSLIKAESENYLLNNYINTHVIRFGLIQNKFDVSFILKNISNKLFIFKGTKVRNIPMTKESSAINSINNHIINDKLPKVTIDIDFQYNLNNASKNIKQPVLYIPNIFFKLLLKVSIILKLKSIEFKLRNLDNKITYETK